MRFIFSGARRSCNGEDDPGDVDGVKIGIPRYSGMVMGELRSIATCNSRIVLRSSAIDSLHSPISASRR